MKKLAKVLVCGALACMLFGCGDAESESKEPEKKVYIKEDQISDLYSNPDEFKGKYVNLTGKVFMVETDGDDIYFQMWQDVEDSDHNTIVHIDKESFKDIVEDDYISLEAVVIGEFEGENMMGGTIHAPKLEGVTIKKSSYKDVVAPTLENIKVEQTKQSNMPGVSITIKNVELAKEETRVYVEINNESEEAYSFYSFNSVLIQDSKQFKENQNWNADYEEVESEIPSGVKETGVIVFEPIQANDFKIIMEGQSEDYSIDSDEFSFLVKIH